MARQTDDTPTTPALSADQFQQLLAHLSKPANAGLDAAALRQILTETAAISAATMQKALKPENPTHHGKSVYSYPEGDSAKSRETILTHDVRWFGVEVRKEWGQQHWLELELAQRLTPGTFYVSGTNNAGTVKVQARGSDDASGQLQTLEVSSDEIQGHRALNIYPPMAVWMYQMVNKDRPLDETYWEGMTLFHNHIVRQKPPVEAFAG